MTGPSSRPAALGGSREARRRRGGRSLARAAGAEQGNTQTGRLPCAHETRVTAAHVIESIQSVGPQGMCAAAQAASSGVGLRRRVEDDEEELEQVIRSEGQAARPSAEASGLPGGDTKQHTEE
jgi:hypothetical protein